MNWGRAVLLYWNIWKRGLVIGVFKAYTALFGGKIGIIGSFRFPERVTTSLFMYTPAQSCFYSFYKRFAANSNTLSPLIHIIIDC
jgi:hypothetical protein